MTSSISFSSLSVACLAMTLGVGSAQQLMTIEEPAKLTVKRDETASQRLKVELKDGYHANSNTPSDAYLIPLKLTWDGAILQTVDVQYPPAKLEKYEFSEKPLSVVSGTFEIVTKFKPAAGAAPGPASVPGKLRYQACNDRMCFPPKTIDVKLPVLVQ